MMRKQLIFMVLTFVMAVQMSFSQKSMSQTNKQHNKPKAKTAVNWQPLINAIIQVESRGNDRAVSKDGSCVGPMQIKMIAVKDCNEYLKSKGEKRRFTSNDRYSRTKSAQMFQLIMERYNKSNSIQTACFIWNQGIGYKKRMNKARVYYNKVIKFYKRA